MAATTQLLITFICTLFSFAMARWPPPGQVCPCTCTLSQDPNLVYVLGPGQYKQVDCRGLNLRDFPQDFPLDTQVVLLSNNNIANLATDNIDDLTNLLYLDLSYNRIRNVPANPFTYTTRLRFVNLGWNRIQNVMANAFLQLQSLNRLMLPSNSLARIPNAINNLSSLHHVDLSKNQITTFDRTAFQLTPRIQTLNLESNSISAIDANIIRQLPQLRTLLLTQNQISFLPTYIFHGMQNLDHVALGKNSIINLPGTIFRGAPRLRIVDLHQNRLAYLDPQLFRGMNFLEEVNLSQNRLQQMPPGIFQGLRVLGNINLQGNDRLRTLPVGIFRGLPGLEEVHLSHMQLIPEGLLWGLGAMESLTITDSNVSPVLSSILRDLPLLQELNFANNQIANIPEGLFERLTFLELLDLSNNQLTTFSMMWFSGNTLQNLGTLNLQNNKIAELPPEAFVQMPKLQSLNLEGNQLSEISENIFEARTQLETLLLSNNNIRKVGPGIIPKLRSVEKLSIINNKLTCDCHLNPFAEWLKMHIGAVESPHEIVCAVPKLYKNRQIIQLVQSPQNPFTCIFPQIMTLPRQRTMYMNNGDSTQLSCDLSASAVADIIWTFPDGSQLQVPLEDPISPAAFNPKIYARASGHLVLQNFARQNTGIYTCQTLNSVGSDEITYDMRLVFAPSRPVAPTVPRRPLPPTTRRPTTRRPMRTLAPPRGTYPPATVQPGLPGNPGFPSRPSFTVRPNPPFGRPGAGGGNPGFPSRPSFTVRPNPPFGRPGAGGGNPGFPSRPSFTVRPNPPFGRPGVGGGNPGLPGRPSGTVRPPFGRPNPRTVRPNPPFGRPGGNPPFGRPNPPTVRPNPPFGRPGGNPPFGRPNPPTVRPNPPFGRPGGNPPFGRPNPPTVRPNPPFGRPGGNPPFGRPNPPTVRPNPPFGRPGGNPSFGRPSPPTIRPNPPYGRPGGNPSFPGRPGVPGRPLNPTVRTGVIPGGRPTPVPGRPGGRGVITAKTGGTVNRTTLMTFTLPPTTLPPSPCNPNPCRHGGICTVVLKDASTDSIEEESQESYSSSLARQGGFAQIYKAATPAGVEQYVADCACRKKWGGPQCQFKKPEMPGTIKILEVDSNLISLSWSRIGNIQGYRILYSKVGDRTIVKSMPIHPQVSSYTMEKLSNDATYRICVVAFNLGGESQIGEQNCIWAETTAKAAGLASFFNMQLFAIGAGCVVLLIILVMSLFCYQKMQKKRQEDEIFGGENPMLRPGPRPNSSASEMIRRSMRRPTNSFYQNGHQQDDVMLIDLANQQPRQMYMNPFDANRHSMLFGDLEGSSGSMPFNLESPRSRNNPRNTLKIQDDTPL